MEFKIIRMPLNFPKVIKMSLESKNYQSVPKLPETYQNATQSVQKLHKSLYLAWKLQKAPVQPKHDQNTIVQVHAFYMTWWSRITPLP